MGFCVYILLNTSRTQTYVGQTEDLGERLKLHNSGRVRSTRNKGPWRLFHIEEYDSRAAAMKRERWYKSPKGRGRIREVLSRAGEKPDR